MVRCVASFLCLVLSVISPVYYAQIINPNILSNLCPGEEVNITCEIRGSITDNIIIAWTSDDYIEAGGTRLEFATFNNVGDTRRSPVNANTIATLINNTIENGDHVLVSKLRIIISEDLITSTVACSTASRMTNSSTLELMERPIPQAKAYQTKDAMGICTLHIAWTMLSNTAITHVVRFYVYIDETQEIEVANVNNETLTTTHYSMCSCTPHSISVRTVNRCGYLSKNSSGISIIPMSLQLEETCETPGPATVHTISESDDPATVHTTPESDGQTCYDVAVIISVTVICGVGIISMVVITLTLCLVYIRYIYKHRATDNSEMDHDQPQERTAYTEV